MSEPKKSAKICAVVLSGRKPISEHGFEVVRRAGHCGFETIQAFPPPEILRNQTTCYLEALKFAVTKLCDNADLYVVFEDDIDIAEGLAGYLSNTWHKFGGGVGIFSPYSPGTYTKHPGYKEERFDNDSPWQLLRPDCKLIGACCLVFPRSSAKMILSDPHAVAAADAGIPIEKYLRDWANKSNRPIYFHNPSLISHQGLTKAGDRDSQMRKESHFERTAPEAVGEVTDLRPMPPGELVEEKTPSPAVVGMRYIAPAVSIIIAGRNSAKWIGDAIKSACNQTFKRCEVIVSDDCSTDNTWEVLNELRASGLEFVPVISNVHSGVVATRNRGAAIARGKYLCFVDSDDIVPDDFIALHLQAFENVPSEFLPAVPFVYGSAKTFGEGPHVGRHWMPTGFSSWDKWSYNTVNTSALYTRWAFDAAGGWKDVPTMWDFDLALRASRFGEPRVSQAILMYRQHANSWSQAVDMANGDKERGHYAEIIHRRNARLAVATIWSGRMSEEFQKTWIDKLAASVMQALQDGQLASKPILVIAIDPDSPVQSVVSDAMNYGNAFSAVRIEWLPFRREPHTDEKTRRDSVARFLARANQWIKSMLAGATSIDELADAVWIVEDDIIVPLTGCSLLWDTLTSGMTCPAAVSGVYRNRHNPKLLVGGTTSDLNGNGTFREFESVPNERLVNVDIVGCGCLMTWLNRPMIPLNWPSHVAGKTPAHDWAYSLEVRRNGGEIFLNTMVRCGHAVNADDVIFP